MSLNLNSSNEELEKRAVEEEIQNIKSAKRLRIIVTTVSILMICGLTYWMYQVILAPSYDHQINDALDVRLNTHGSKTIATLDDEYTQVTTTYQGGGQYTRGEYTYSFKVNGDTYSGEDSSIGAITSRTINIIYDPENPNINKIENTSYNRYKSLNNTADVN